MLHRTLSFWSDLWLVFTLSVIKPETMGVPVGVVKWLAGIASALLLTGIGASIGTYMTIDRLVYQVGLLQAHEKDDKDAFRENELAYKELRELAIKTDKDVALMNSKIELSEIRTQARLGKIEATILLKRVAP